MNATNRVFPYSYLIIGSGRVARHLAHYFNLLNIHHQTWDRSQDPHALGRKVAPASHILLAISDSALEGFYRQKLAGHEAKIVQFSGAHHFDGMISAHPLMTFGPELYELEFYKKIHFVLTGADSLEDVLPGLPNPWSVLPPEQKALYHSYCVIGGNFVTLLMQQMLAGLKELNIPSAAGELYLQKVFENTLKASESALTGPLVRKDQNTVEANLKALQGHPSLFIYEAFLKTYWSDYGLTSDQSASGKLTEKNSGK